jgi:hypothetical protein
MQTFEDDHNTSASTRQVSLLPLMCRSYVAKLRFFIDFAWLEPAATP